MLAGSATSTDHGRGLASKIIVVSSAHVRSFEEKIIRQERTTELTLRLS